MAQKIAYQTDAAGHYTGTTTADESPLEAGVWHFPAGAVGLPPPPREDWPAGKWPRWIGRRWEFVNEPKSAAQDSMEKLQAFLAANPDVAKLIS